MFKFRIGLMRCCGIAVYAFIVCVTLSSRNAAGSVGGRGGKSLRVLSDLQHSELTGPDGGKWKKYDHG